MKAEEARQIYYDAHLGDALDVFYNAIREQATKSLSWNFYDIAVNYDYDILRLVSKELQEQGYGVHYSDGEVRSTKIFRITW